MDRWFSSPKIFDHLWCCKTKAVGTVLSNRKEMPKEEFSEKLKKGEKISRQRDHLLAIKWKDIRNVFFLNTALKMYLLRHHHQGGHIRKCNPLQCWTTTNIKLVWTDRTRCCPIIHLKEKVVEKTFLLPIRPGSGQFTHPAYQDKQEKMSKIFYEKVAKGLLASAGTEMQVQGQTSSPAGRDHFYIGFQRHMPRWRELHSAYVVCVQRRANARLAKL